MDLTDAQLLAISAQYSLDDLYYFNSEIMRFGTELSDGVLFTIPREQIGPIIDWLSLPRPSYLPAQARRKRFLALPRGTTKTSMVSGYAAREILKDPNISIFYTSELKALAVEVVKDIGARLTAEPVLRRWGPLRPGTGWREDRFTVATRTRPRKDPTMMAGGIDVPIQGFHFDLIIADDLQGVTNNSVEGIRKVREYLRLLMPVLNPGGELIWICTRWGYDDAASHILKEAREVPGSWEYPGLGYFGAYVRPQDLEFFTWLRPEHVGTSLWPSVLPDDEPGGRLRATLKRAAEV